MVLDPHSLAIAVALFESADPPDHWTRLDNLEGPDYTVGVTTVHTIPETPAIQLRADVGPARDSHLRPPASRSGVVVRNG